MHVSLGLRTVAIADGIQNRAYGDQQFFDTRAGSIVRLVPHHTLHTHESEQQQQQLVSRGRMVVANTLMSRHRASTITYGILPIDQGSTEGYPLDTRQFIFPFGRWRCRCDIGQPIIFHATSSTV